jgi:serine/threonine-protein kinase RsbW
MSRAAPLGRRLTAAIAASYDEVAAMRALLGVAAADLGFPRATLLQLEICLTEALHNVIRHSYAGRDDGEIEVSFRVPEGRLEIEIVDGGAPMPDRARRSLDDGAPLPGPDGIAVPDLPEGGFGIPILHSALDGVEYRRDGDCNVLRLTKRVPARPDAASSDRPRRRGSPAC